MLQQLGLQVLRIDGNLASGNLSVTGSAVAQFADRNRFHAETHGGPEGAAGDGPGGIEITGAGGGIEGGTWLVLPSLVAFERVRERIRGGFPAQSFHRSLGAPANAERPLGIPTFEIGEACPQTDGIQRRYGKRSDTALVAAGAADEPGAAAARRLR
jgi:hypothetical protein